MNKNISVVAEVASYAKKMGRTFVEPMYCRSRVAPPFASPPAHLARALAAHGLKNIDWSCRGQDKVPLSAARDVRQACGQVPMISPAAFLARLETRPALRNSTTLLSPKIKNRKFFHIRRQSMGKAILYVAGLHRHINYNQIAEGYCVRAARPCFGMQFGAAPALVEDAKRAAAAAGRYTCVNIRTEWLLNEGQLRRCPERIYAAARRAWTALPGARATTLVVSDIFAETSGTYKGKGDVKAAMRDKLEALLFTNATDQRRLVAAAGPGKGPLEALLARCQPGSAPAAVTEQLLCAAADTVVMCTRPLSCYCGHGLQSGFVSTIKWFRASLGRSTASDVAGGLYSF